MSTTRRAAVVAIVVCALAFTIAVPLRTYLSQRAEVAEEEARQAELRQEVGRLEDRKAELSDPAQVEAGPGQPQDTSLLLLPPVHSGTVP